MISNVVSFLLTRHFYKIDKFPYSEFRYSLMQEVSNAYIFGKVTDDFRVVVEDDSPISLDKKMVDSLINEGKVSEVFKEPHKISRDQIIFNLVMKIIASEEIDEGCDDSDIDHYEHEYSLFSKLWNIPRDEEKEWFTNLDRDSYSSFKIPEDIWFEDSEHIEKALIKMQTIKKYLSEL